ncbi:MAG: hydroxymethylbilane synthase [Planctomycetaceae bacterium]|jgi:hydroxymethylbilane synthase|nr:hydroxymethylbilane synthase [Planctomycetaceae bacterium]
MVGNSSVSCIRIGTRGSKLALWQANFVAGELKKHNIETEIAVVKTSGDAVQDRSIENIGAQGVFTREIQRALLNGEIDIAVHSLKDLPTEPVDGLYLAAVPERGAYRDAFLCNTVEHIEDLPKDARVGTGSLRRRTQIFHRLGNLFQLLDVRGNVETRIRKLDAGEYDALILAEAGLRRLGFADRICSCLEPPIFLPAAGQGALGIEVAEKNRKSVGNLLNRILLHRQTFSAVLAERAFLRTLQGGCIAPIGVFGQVIEGQLTLHGRILSPDGRTAFEKSGASSVDAPETLGTALAEELLKAGAGKIIEQIQQLRQQK